MYLQTNDKFCSPLVRDVHHSLLYGKRAVVIVNYKEMKDRTSFITNKRPWHCTSTNNTPIAIFTYVSHDMNNIQQNNYNNNV